MAGDLNALDQANIVREIAKARTRIQKLEAILKGSPINVLRLGSAVITNAKIENVSASKITSGTLAVGEKILISDGVNNRIRITRDEIRISKPGVDVEQTITETNKKDFVILNTVEADKLIFAGIIEDTTYTHSLGYVPWFKVFTVDDPDNPTEFTRKIQGVEADDTTISGFDNPSYLMIFHRSV